MKAPVDNSVSKLDDHGYILAGKFRHRLADSLAIPVGLPQRITLIPTFWSRHRWQAVLEFL